MPFIRPIKFGFNTAICKMLEEKFKFLEIICKNIKQSDIANVISHRHKISS